MTVNINIDNMVEEVAQTRCSKDSAGTGDVLALYMKVATTLVLCALLVSGFVTVLRAIRVVHADLIATRRAGVHAQIPTVSEDSTESVPLDTEVASELEADAAAAPDSSEDGEMLRMWREVGNFTFAWLGRSVSATATTVTAMIPRLIPDVEAEYELPVPCP
ncbi:hypothetical protein GSI_02783 [Ganoderma sinense ZZ0214-1]|uniref:Uncharacterized protein n=1 Tax=Ganoderma sinense ZZ0214-1 TaxID=1077348 RepID=A0A2G8SMK3_9APHY|nr:hypothetical protein GSI_02783 [Ganoderma sinense ZZ0214-1]